MEKPSTAQTVYKLLMAGGQAGFSLEQMIQILNSGVSVKTLLHLIEERLGATDSGPAVLPAGSCSREVIELRHVQTHLARKTPKDLSCRQALPGRRRCRFIPGDVQMPVCDQ